ncbi:ribonuclease H-like domain-containing protein [Tanacetum coccineum]
MSVFSTKKIFLNVNLMMYGWIADLEARASEQGEHTSTRWIRGGLTISYTLDNLIYKYLDFEVDLASRVALVGTNGTIDSISINRISKLDISNPLHLHPNDTFALTVVSIKLKGTENYQVWSCAMLLALEGKNKIGFIGGSCKRSKEDEVLGKQLDRYDAMIELPKCVCNASEGFKKHNQLLKLMQFLMGLDDSYMQIRSSILPRETLPDVRSAYATISSEESHRVAVGSITGEGSGLNNNRPSGGSGLVCENCSFNGHTIIRCFKIIGYPANFGKKKFGQNFKKQSVSNNNSVGKSSSSGFTDEQMATLISLIKDNKVGKNVQANMAENKVIVTFDENRCYFLNKDLNLKNVMGIGEQCEGLLGHPADPVLNVLKYSLNIDKKDNTICCEFYQRAKQTREPFPLSDHKSKSLGDLVHLDLWGTYKVTSSEGFRFFLTVVDDYTRAVWVYLIKSKDEDSEVRKNDSTNVFQDVNHINFFDIEYPEIPNDDESVANDLNKGKSDSISSSEFGSNINTANFPVDLEMMLIAIKFRSSGEIDRYKAKLVAQGFGQKEGIDYEETFSPVVKMVTVRCLLNIHASMSWHVFQLDVNTAFLYGDLEEVVFLKPPEGYFPSDNKSKSDYSLYTKSNKGVFLTLLVYVDDIIITDNSVFEIEKFKVFLKSKFMIKDLGKLKYFLGIEVVDTDKGICLNQRKYVLDLLSEYGMLACKPAKTPLMSKIVISNEASYKDPLLENITDYQKLIEKLIYLTNIMPNLSYAVHCLSQFMHSPLTSHLKIAFKILRYLKSCPGLGVHVTKTSGMFFTAYSDDDWAKYIVTRKSIIGYCVFLNNSLVS